VIHTSEDKLVQTIYKYFIYIICTVSQASVTRDWRGAMYRARRGVGGIFTVGN
jgi:hypothetical protein